MPHVILKPSSPLYAFFGTQPVPVALPLPGTGAGYALNHLELTPRQLVNLVTSLAVDGWTREVVTNQIFVGWIVPTSECALIPRSR